MKRCHINNLADWFGEKSFWMDENDEEYEFNEHEYDNSYMLFQDIEDPDGEEQIDDDTAEELAFKARTGTFVFPPTLAEAEAAFSDIKTILKPP